MCYSGVRENHVIRDGQVDGSSAKRAPAEGEVRERKTLRKTEAAVDLSGIGASAVG